MKTAWLWRTASWKRKPELPVCIQWNKPACIAALQSAHTKGRATEDAQNAPHSGRILQNQGGKIPWRYTEEKFLRRSFTGGGLRNRAASGRCSSSRTRSATGTAPTVIAAAITSRLDKARLPTHINIRAADTGLAKDSVVLLEQIRTLDKHRLREAGRADHA